MVAVSASELGVGGVVFTAGLLGRILGLGLETFELGVVDVSKEGEGLAIGLLVKVLRLYLLVAVVRAALDFNGRCEGFKGGLLVPAGRLLATVEVFRVELGVESLGSEIGFLVKVIV